MAAEQSNGPVMAYLWTPGGGQTFLVVEASGPLPDGVQAVDLNAPKQIGQGNEDKPVDASKLPVFYGAINVNPDYPTEVLSEH